MTRSLAPAALLALTLAACGGDTCNTNPASLQNTSGGASCSVAAGQPVTFSVALTCKCTDSSPSCQAEYFAPSASGGERIEVAPVFQQCQASAGCATGCAISQPTATCSVVLPASVSGQVPVQVIGDIRVTDSVTVGGGSTSCTL
jgi:hypothetical protein